MGNRLIVYSAEQIGRRRLELKVSLHPSNAKSKATATTTTTTTETLVPRTKASWGFEFLVSSRARLVFSNQLSQCRSSFVYKSIEGNQWWWWWYARKFIEWLFVCDLLFSYLIFSPNYVQSTKYSIRREKKNYQSFIVMISFCCDQVSNTQTRRSRRDVLILSRRLGPNAYDSHFHRNSFYSSEI